ncbi:MAG: hypothetical protein PHR24_03525 [Oscillospiraceae bacterium]|nr:hypothetical protein [Oscillospiraceae bacterium]MDD3832271.1 hypothetical protein [Oscillospiraceae bacterium]MDD4546343.1 hypothetical protein [Oscillospiraceae bacterium]
MVISMAKDTKKGRNNKRVRLIFLTWIMSFFLLVMLAGFIIADYNSRRVGFGDESLRFDISAQQGQFTINMFGRESTFEISDEVSKWTGRVWHILPPGIRAAFWTFEYETQATQQLARQVILIPD